MDGENNGKPYFLMDDLGEKTLFSETPIWSLDPLDCKYWISQHMSRVCLIIPLIVRKHSPYTYLSLQVFLTPPHSRSYCLRSLWNRPTHPTRYDYRNWLKKKTSRISSGFPHDKFHGESKGAPPLLRDYQPPLSLNKALLLLMVQKSQTTNLGWC